MAKKAKPAPVKKARINSRTKGKTGELELVSLLKQHGYNEARRGQQFKGGTDSPDVVCPGLEEVHWEAKRVEHGSLYAWLAQAINDAGPGKVPVVAHRRNKMEWVAILRLEDLLNLFLARGK